MLSNAEVMTFAFSFAFLLVSCISWLHGQRR